MSLNMIFLFIKIFTDWFYDLIINLIFGSLFYKSKSIQVTEGLYKGFANTEVLIKRSFFGSNSK